MMHDVDDDTPLEAALARAIEDHRARRAALSMMVVLSAALVAWFARRRPQH